MSAPVPQERLQTPQERLQTSQDPAQPRPRVRVKICGLSREEDIAAVNRYLPDYIGFVFAPSRRQVAPERARKLKSLLDGRIQAVGVFVNETIPTIAAICREGIIDLIQLHGEEGEAYIRELKAAVGCPVIKAVRIKPAASQAAADELETATSRAAADERVAADELTAADRLPCDLLLLDSWREGMYGGSGETFDHAQIPVLKKPWFLAGGLNESIIREVLAAGRIRPFGLDVSSGAETGGLKDEDKIRRILEAARKG